MPDKPILAVVSSLVIQARPETLQQVSDHLAKQSNIEVHASDEFSKLVIVAEMPDDIALSDFMNEVAKLDGVITVNMVFHHTDTEEDETEQAELPNEAVITFKEANNHA